MNYEAKASDLESRIFQIYEEPGLWIDKRTVAKHYIATALRDAVNEAVEAERRFHRETERTPYGGHFP